MPINVKCNINKEKIMKEKKYTEKIFDDIKHFNEFGVEYWLARELQKVLEYKKWENFCLVVDNAKIACNESKYKVDDHFAVQRKNDKISKGCNKRIMYKVRIIIILLIMKLVRKTVVRCLRRWKDLIKV